MKHRAIEGHEVGSFAFAAIDETNEYWHTHTSLLIEANVHIKETQERLGHSDINTTMDIYAQPMTKKVKKRGFQ